MMEIPSLTRLWQLHNATYPGQYTHPEFLSRNFSDHVLLEFCDREIPARLKNHCVSPEGSPLEIFLTNY
jgi:hypothetical protein